MVAELRDELGDAFGDARVTEARDVFERVALADTFIEFLTLPAYELLD